MYYYDLFGSKVRFDILIFAVAKQINGKLKCSNFYGSCFFINIF